MGHTLAYPYYSLSVQMQDGGSSVSKSVTKSISGINLPDMSTDTVRNKVADDLQAVAQLINNIMLNVFNKAILTTREEVIGNG